MNGRNIASAAVDCGLERRDEILLRRNKADSLLGYGGDDRRGGALDGFILEGAFDGLENILLALGADAYLKIKFAG